MVSGLLLCWLLTITAANPVPMDNVTAPFQRQGVQDIVNGVDSEYGRFNSILSLKKNCDHACGAALISPTTAITAAHCVESSSRYTVVAGELHFDQDNGHEVSRAVKQIIVHPQYNVNDFWTNDIAILKFDEIPLDTYIEPIEMVTDADGDLAGMVCVIAGWGKTSGQAQGRSRMLQWSVVQALSNSLCNDLWQLIDDTHICVGFLENRVSTCDGDGGSPLACLVTGGEKLAGVATWRHRDCPGTHPSVYTRISKYQDWIAQYM